MSKTDPVGTNPNDQMPEGDGLKHGEIVPEEFEDDELYAGNDGREPAGDEDQAGSTEEIGRGKNQRDRGSA
jgi:hypothetical protein